MSDDEWTVLEPLIPLAKAGGRRRTTDMREVINAILYVLCTGCQWDWLPHDFPPKGTVFHYFNTWRKDGTWERWNRILSRKLRQSEGREPTPIAAILDSQSVKTTEKGRKRLRQWQAGEGTQAPSAGGHPRPGDESVGNER